MTILSIVDPVYPPDTSVSHAVYPLTVPPVTKLRLVYPVLFVSVIVERIFRPELTRTTTTSRPTYPTPVAVASCLGSVYSVLVYGQYGIAGGILLFSMCYLTA